MSTMKSLRRRRRIYLGFAGFDLFFLGFDLSDGSYGFAAVMAVCAVIMLRCVLLRTRDINRREALARRPDYVSIARMEQVIYGRTFDHRRGYQGHEPD